VITRFAPSPTGPLHLGHAYSAILAHDMARAAGGDFVLRIEDIDQSRARQTWEGLIYEDLTWLGLTWDGPVMRQSERLDVYRAQIEDFWTARAVFACTCNRRDIFEAASAPNEGTPTYGPDGILYPGTCRDRKSSGDGQTMPADCAFRLDTAYATTRPNVFEHPISSTDSGENIAFFTETGSGPSGETGDINFTDREIIETVGDIVLARRDMGTSYHLSVVMDDAEQGITHVIRGQDLFEATKIHVVLQRLLGLPTLTYHHHRLIRDDDGKRLAKRDDARAIRTYRDAGATPAEIRRMVGL
jgi:glutamyl-Q tRNA(Asp) synthetase